VNKHVQQKNLLSKLTVDCNKCPVNCIILSVGKYIIDHPVKVITRVNEMWWTAGYGTRLRVLAILT